MELFHQGDVPDEVFVIREGIVKLLWSNTEGAETIVGLRWPGWFLGTAALIAGTTNPVTAVTLVPSRLERISSEKFIYLITSDMLFMRKVQLSHVLLCTEKKRFCLDLRICAR